MNTNRIAIGLVPLLLAGGLACKKNEPPPPPPPAPITMPPTTAPAPLSVAALTLGTAVGADKRVSSPTDSFRPADTIYASVETTGAGQQTLRALWTFVRGDKTAKVDETSLAVNAAGPAVHEFHVSKPGGWPKGDYKVEIFLGGSSVPAMTRNFKVG
jgi:hypothetical protein